MTSLMTFYLVITGNSNLLTLETFRKISHEQERLFSSSGGGWDISWGFIWRLLLDNSFICLTLIFVIWFRI